MTSLYTVLGVSADATAEEIKRAYRKKTLEAHPDRHGNTPEATRKFQDIQHAYTVLSDADRRARHNAELHGRRYRGRSSPQSWGARPQQSPSNDPRADLVEVTTVFGELVNHNVKYGVIKNTLLVVFAAVATFSGGWWGWLLGMVAISSMAWGATAWMKILYKAPAQVLRANRRK